MPKFDQLILHTERLLLRPLCATDAAGMFRLRADEKVMQYGASPPWTSMEQADTMIARDMKAMEEGTYLRLGLVRPEDDVLIGGCTLFHLDEQCRRAEIGYELLPDMWGQGYMREALAALLEFGFTEMSLNRVEADVDPRNAPSANILVRLGFKHEGLLKERWIVNGEKADTAFYGLLCAEWQAATGRA
ncbi:GNAT family N-acetyltransferase [Undibacterium sp.]|uniref:GNAT family N-acetyltransferase n=1 Tax=Undibacterium sp. TaxID=1914977 RepID=UPI00374D4F30